MRDAKLVVRAIGGGMEVLPDLGGLSLREQATAWASADVMVFPHGPS